MIMMQEIFLTCLFAMRSGVLGLSNELNGLSLGAIGQDTKSSPHQM